jgi:hypothetical protein
MEDHWDTARQALSGWGGIEITQIIEPLALEICIGCCCFLCLQHAVVSRLADCAATFVQADRQVHLMSK